MKTLLTLLLSCSFLTGFGAKTGFEKLCEVNKCWQEQPDIGNLPIMEGRTMNEKEWIGYHLLLVEQVLRNRDISRLTPLQQLHREQSLDHLHTYLTEGNFPINEDYDYRTPIFIDKHNNFCAVGYLVKASGHESVSRMVASRTNLAYVRDMHYPELNSWAYENGFTMEELAWIQPGYPPSRVASAIGKGTDGEVITLFADEADERLYVGGSFANVDSTQAAGNIAYVTELNGTYTWHNMDIGVNGPVHAITKFNNKIFVAGAFGQAGGENVNNVAYWDGAAWHAAGCTYGSVKDLLVFNGALYAAGDFDVCAALPEVNFARWNDTIWQQMPGLQGHVNTMAIMDTFIVLGGAFQYWTGDQLNVIKWSPNAGFEAFDNGIGQEVKDLELYHDTLYAVCRQRDPGDRKLFMQLKNNAWDTVATYLPINGFTFDDTLSFNTLCVQNDTFLMGGDFHYVPMMGAYLNGCVNVSGPYTAGNCVSVDSAINKMVVFKDEVILGGKFKFGNYNTLLNGIAKQKSIIGSGVPGTPNPVNEFSIYPNPAGSAGTILVSNNGSGEKLNLFDMKGQLVATYELRGPATSIALPALAPGNYMAAISTTNGQTLSKQLVVQ